MKVLQIKFVSGIRSTGHICTDLAVVIPTDHFTAKKKKVKTWSSYMICFLDMCLCTWKKKWKTSR